jgi:hypothetical protein
LTRIDGVALEHVTGLASLAQRLPALASANVGSEPADHAELELSGQRWETETRQPVQWRLVSLLNAVAEAKHSKMRWALLDVEGSDAFFVSGEEQELDRAAKAQELPIIGASAAADWQ